MRLGLREANQKFSQAIKAVKAGEEVILTERGRPIAVIKPLNGTDRVNSAITRLEMAGFLRRAAKAKAMPDWKPRALRGAPLSQTLREERDLP